jgi:hypothetical protein
VGAYKVAGTQDDEPSKTGTAVVRNCMPGGVGGRRGQPRLLTDWLVLNLIAPLMGLTTFHWFLSPGRRYADPWKLFYAANRQRCSLAVPCYRVSIVVLAEPLL